MFSIDISEDYAVYQEGASEGTQVKYRKDGCWYKIDRHGEEGLVEYLVSNVLKFLKDNMGYDATKYLQKILTVDFLSLNTDRHFNNLGFIVHKNGTISDAPIFDNGLGLLNGNVSINKHLSIAENTKRVIARPFSGSHRKMLDYVGVGFKLDVDGAKKWLQEQPQTFYRDVLLYQLDYTRDILQNEMNLPNSFLLS
ncbi:MAG: hypothetical protein K2G45_09535 [Lachnospiraceae bacterium]|nr:hypothetical protein [Lachnospiraceae bacterium]